MWWLIYTLRYVLKRAYDVVNIHFTYVLKSAYVVVNIQFTLRVREPMMW